MHLHPQSADPKRNRSLFEFNLEAWIRFDVVDDFVIAGHKFGDRDPTSVSAEFPQLIKVERNELLDKKAAFRETQRCRENV